MHKHIRSMYSEQWMQGCKIMLPTTRRLCRTMHLVIRLVLLVFTTDASIQMSSTDAIRDIRIRGYFMTIQISGYSPQIPSGWSYVTAKAPIAEFSTYFSCLLLLILSSISSPKIHQYHYTIANMSDSSLSPPLQSEISLPTLPPLLSPTLQLRRITKKPRLASTDSDLFTSGLFSRMLLETTPPTMQLRYL